jgi:iron(III) transport system ATP-binding protein
MAELEVKNVSISFGDVNALSGVSITLGKGEVLMLKGPSGSGKTTLLRIIAGLERPDTGEVTLGGKTLVSRNACVPPERRDVGMVFQEPALWPHMRVLGNLTFVLNKLPRHERRERARGILDRLGVGALARRYPHELSAGERRRVAIGRLLAARPAVWLLDEPLVNLDPELRAGLAALIKNIRDEEGVSILHVSHFEKEPLDYSDRVAIIKQGKIVSIEKTGT